MSREQKILNRLYFTAEGICNNPGCSRKQLFASVPYDNEYKPTPSLDMLINRNGLYVYIIRKITTFSIPVPWNEYVFISLEAPAL